MTPVLRHSLPKSRLTNKSVPSFSTMDSCRWIRGTGSCSSTVSKSKYKRSKPCPQRRSPCDYKHQRVTSRFMGACPKGKLSLLAPHSNRSDMVEAQNEKHWNWSLLVLLSFINNGKERSVVWEMWILRGGSSPLQPSGNDWSFHG